MIALVKLIGATLAAGALVFLVWAALWWLVEFVRDVIERD